MFHHSYQARKFSGNLAIIAFGGLGGDSGDAKLFKSLSNSSLSRDERAPVNPTAEDLAGFERRRDIQDLHQEMRETVDQGAQNRVSKRIANIINDGDEWGMEEASMEAIHMLGILYLDLKLTIHTATLSLTGSMTTAFRPSEVRVLLN
jgi:hypothetical protein